GFARLDAARTVLSSTRGDLRVGCLWIRVRGVVSPHRSAPFLPEPGIHGDGLPEPAAGLALGTARAPLCFAKNTTRSPRRSLPLPRAGPAQASPEGERTGRGDQVHSAPPRR